MPAFLAGFVVAAAGEGGHALFEARTVLMIKLARSRLIAGCIWIRENPAAARVQR